MMASEEVTEVVEDELMVGSVVDCPSAGDHWEGYLDLVSIALSWVQRQTVRFHQQASLVALQAYAETVDYYPPYLQQFCPWLH